ncbi:MAG: alpha-galactosidase, partial [Pacificimonas sp.]
MSEVARLASGDIELIVAREGSAIRLVHLGARLPDEDVSTLALATTRGLHENEADERLGQTFLPVEGTGFLGTPAMDGQDFDAMLAAANVDITDSLMRMTWSFADDRLSIRTDIRAMGGGVFTVATSARNGRGGDVSLARLASITLPLPSWVTHRTTWSGRWAGEMCEETVALGRAAIQEVSRGGRPGFGGGDWLMLQNGEAGRINVLAIHLAWSGDYERLVELDENGGGQVQMGTAVGPDGIALTPGTWTTMPTVHLAVSTTGRDCLRQSLHRHVITNVLPSAHVRKKRKLHLNTWEALTFDVSENALIRLATDAAALGVERFVLDDGWFAGRRNDRK